MVVEVGVDHLDLAAMEVVGEVVDLAETVETTVEMIEEVVVEEAELASIVTGLDIWQEIVLKATAEEEIVEEEVDLEEEEGVVAGLATIATKKGIWQENAPKETVEIAEADKRNVYFLRLAKYRNIEFFFTFKRLNFL